MRHLQFYRFRLEHRIDSLNGSLLLRAPYVSLTVILGRNVTFRDAVKSFPSLLISQCDRGVYTRRVLLFVLVALRGVLFFVKVYCRKPDTQRPIIFGLVWIRGG